MKCMNTNITILSLGKMTKLTDTDKDEINSYEVCEMVQGLIDLNIYVRPTLRSMLQQLNSKNLKIL